MAKRVSNINIMVVEGEWEVPVGLTAEHAIYVNSSSDDDDHVNVTCTDNPSTCDDAVLMNKDVTIDKAGSSSSYFKNNSLEVQADDVDDSCAKVTTNFNSLPHQNNDEAKPPLKQPSEDSDKQNDSNDNPFAAFAFNADKEPTSTLPSWQTRKKRSLPMLTTSTSMNSKPKKCKQNKQMNNTTKQSNNKKTWSIAELQTKTGGEEQLEKEEHRQELIKKWHSFSDPNAPIEVRRFQVLTAARIHARCQEPIVHKAMIKLREYFAEKETNDDETAQSLSAQCLAQCNAETDIAPLLSSVLFGNVKAQHIVQAAKDVLNMFRGQVPEQMGSLTNITGIGPKLSQILYIVNRRDTYSSKS